MDTLNDRFIEFSLGGQSFGFPMNYIQQVISPQVATKIPGVPDYYLGIINLRGNMVSIIDLRKKLKIKPSEKNSEEAIIVLSLNNSLIGVVVDSVNKVLNCSQDTLSVVPEIAGEPNNPHVSAIYKGGDSLTALLDVEVIFKSAENVKSKLAVA